MKAAHRKEVAGVKDALQQMGDDGSPQLRWQLLQQLIIMHLCTQRLSQECGLSCGERILLWRLLPLCIDQGRLSPRAGMFEAQLHGALKSASPWDGQGYQLLTTKHAGNHYNAEAGIKQQMNQALAVPAVS